MPKKKFEVTSPTVTNLPLPISDTPLVIDLPDGQKIVIGKMQTGSVIEVATWRGTGRPDSRTNRLMMGMNSGTSSTPEAPSNSGQATESKTQTGINNWKTKVTSALKSVTPITKLTVNKIKSSLKNNKPVAAKISTADENVSAKLNDSSEVDEWLKKVLEKSQKSATRAALESSSPRKSTASIKKAPASKRKK